MKAKRRTPRPDPPSKAAVKKINKARAKKKAKKSGPPYIG